MTIWHRSLFDRFLTLPKHQQLLMAANELNRADNMRMNPREYKNALERALELLDFLSYDHRWQAQLKELRRAREYTAMLYIGRQPKSTETLQKCLVQLEASAWKYLNGLP